RPTPELIAQSNLKKFMDRHGIASFPELLERSTSVPRFNDSTIEPFNDSWAWFWQAVLEELDIRFYQPYSRIVDLSRGVPWPQWCVGGVMNIVHNCLDKYAGTLIDEHIALRWEGEEGSVRTLTYSDLRRQVNQPATALRALGLGKGDSIGVFMRMTPRSSSQCW